MSRFTLSFVLVSSLWLVACSDDGGAADPSPDAGETPAPDAGSPADASPLADADPNDTCDEVALLGETIYRPVDVVKKNALVLSTAGGVTTAKIDATAGGFGMTAENPYVYVDLAANAQVEISDTAALTSTQWHIAFKRFSVRVNGGDSGPGGSSVAFVETGTLAEVSAPPAASAFVSDDWSSETCEVVTTMSGDPATAMSDWYDYSTGMLTARPRVYVIRTAAGTHYKVRMINYYGPASGQLTVEWAAL